MGYSSLLKSPKKEEEQEVPNSIWDDFKAFFELSDNEEKPPLQQLDEYCSSVVYGGPLDWDLMDHHLDDDVSLSETKTNHGGDGDDDEADQAEACGRVVLKACSSDGDGEIMKMKKKVLLNLNLNYEEVLEAWSGRGSLWAAGSSLSNPTHAGYMGEIPTMEEERTRRVLRYKEKRHTRLFSKKIRYQVCKLNAEKRPRIKNFSVAVIVVDLKGPTCH